jgi:hypothetical protein
MRPLDASLPTPMHIAYRRSPPRCTTLTASTHPDDPSLTASSHPDDPSQLTAAGGRSSFTRPSHNAARGATSWGFACEAAHGGVARARLRIVGLRAARIHERVEEDRPPAALWLLSLHRPVGRFWAVPTDKPPSPHRKRCVSGSHGDAHGAHTRRVAPPRGCYKARRGAARVARRAQRRRPPHSQL